MKIIASLIIASILFGCGEKEKNHFFSDFNSIEHYSFPKEYDDSVYSFAMAPCDTTFNEIENIWCEIIFNKKKSIEEFEPFLNGLISSGFSLETYSEQEKLDQLNNAFTPAEPKMYDMYECAPVYRDILVFKKDNKIKGVAQICFQCEKSNFIGAAEDIGHFMGTEKFNELERAIKK